MLERFRCAFNRTNTWNEIVGELNFYRGKGSNANFHDQAKKVTPAALAISSLWNLISHENFQLLADEQKEVDKTGLTVFKYAIILFGMQEPLKGLAYSLPPLFSRYHLADFVRGWLILPVLNRLQIWLTTFFEFSLRTIAAGFMWLSKKLNPSDHILVKAIFIIPRIAILAVSQVFTMGADIFSYTRKLFDAAIHLLNPILWAENFLKRMGCAVSEQPIPSLKHSAINLTTASLSLVPAVGIASALIFSGGLTLPFSHILTTTGAAVINAVAISIFSVFAKIIAGCVKAIEAFPKVEDKRKTLAAIQSQAQVQRQRTRRHVHQSSTHCIFAAMAAEIERQERAPIRDEMAIEEKAYRE